MLSAGEFEKLKCELGVAAALEKLMVAPSNSEFREVWHWPSGTGVIRQPGLINVYCMDTFRKRAILNIKREKLTNNKFYFLK